MTKSKSVIFLDMDGVIVTPIDNAINCLKGQNGGMRSDVSRQTIDMMNAAYVKKPYDIVLSSSWRVGHSPDFMTGFFMGAGLLPKLHKESPFTPIIKHWREDEIQAWLDEHPDIDDYLIFDDEDYDIQKPELQERLIKFSVYNGLRYNGIMKLESWLDGGLSEYKEFEYADNS